jgi:NAD(P)-dependent dehydrogenase (short-subunit alcohol dehydrogenase family)
LRSLFNWFDFGASVMANKSKMQGKSTQTRQRPPQRQTRQPGRQTEMKPKPVSIISEMRGSGKLSGKVALITGGDSGIGRAVSIAFAREGANIAVVYLEEDKDAEDVRRAVENEGTRCMLIRGSVATSGLCRQAVNRTVKKFGRLDVLINNAAVQYPRESIEQIDEKQLDATFRTNVYSMFFLTKAALPHLRKQSGSSIINTASVTAYRGSPQLLDYSATKGAIVSFTRSLSQALAKEGIRVNAVAPGPIWTPLIPASFDEEKVASFGADTPLGRAGEPWECAGCYVFLASLDASYMTGQVLHPNGGEIING